MEVIEQDLNGQKFYQVKNFLGSWHDKQTFINDIENELDTDLGPLPLYQTKHYLHNKLQSKHWKQFFSNVLMVAKKLTNKKFKIVESWANKITEESKFYLHTHPANISFVYYLHPIHEAYGTIIKMNEKEFILPGIENSALFFNGNIPHEIVHPPKEIVKLNPRYSIALDLNETNA